MLRIEKRMNLNFFKKIIKLDICCSKYEIYDFNELKLEYLNISKCPNITNLNHIISLKELIVINCIIICIGSYPPCKNNNEGVSGLTNLEILDISNHEYINDVNYMKKLRILYADGWCCGINN